MMGWDKKAIRMVDTLLADNILREEAVAILVDLRATYTQKGFFTGGQRQLIKNLRQENEDRILDRNLAAQLREAIEAGMVEDLSMSFVTSVLSQQERTGSFSVAQREHVEKILRSNTDPSDAEIDQRQVRRNKLTRGDKLW